MKEPIQCHLFYEVIDTLIDMIEAIDPGTVNVGDRRHDVLIIRHMGHLVCPGGCIDGATDNRFVLYVVRLIFLYIYV